MYHDFKKIRNRDREIAQGNDVDALLLHIWALSSTQLSLNITDGSDPKNKDGSNTRSLTDGGQKPNK